MAGSGKHDSEPSPAYRFAVADEQAFVQFDEDWLLRIAESVLRDEQVATAEVSIALVDDATIHDINRRYLDHDCPTDVISFSLREDDSPVVGGDGVSETDRRLDGELVISGETAARVAGEIGCPPAEELVLYLVHGLLHLCGYDDQTDADRSQMREREQAHLQKFGIRPHY